MILYFNIFTNKKSIKSIIYILFCFLFFGNNVVAQDENKLYTKFILENNSIENESELFQNFSKIKEHLKCSEKNDFAVIYKVLLANLFSNKENDVSKKCLDLYESALKNVNSSDNIGLQIWVKSQIGFYFYKFYKYDKASNYFLNTSRLLQEYSDVNIVDPVSVLKYNAYFFTSINEKKLSNIFLKKALHYTPKTDINYAAFLNAIADNYYNLGKIDSAYFFLNETIKYSKINKDSLRLAKSFGDLSQIFIFKKDYKNAEKLLLDDIKISKRINNLKNTIFAQIRLGKMYLKQEKFHKAKIVFNNALANIRNQPMLQSWDLEVNKNLLVIAIREDDQRKELIYRRQIDSITPIVDTIDGTEILKRISWKNEIEIANWKFESEKAKLKQASILKSTFIIISLMLLCILVLLVITFKRKLKFQQIVFENSLLNSQLEKIKAEQALIEANVSLVSFKEFLTVKNNEIVKLENSLNELKLSSFSTTNDEKLNLENLISSHLMTEENWQAFKTTFIKEEADFYKDIILKLPDISESNLRIILLHRIGLKNQEISNLLGITVHGVKKAKQRLRLKYQDSISGFI